MYVYDNGRVFNDNGKLVYQADEPVVAHRRRTLGCVNPPKGYVGPISLHIMVMKSHIAFVFEQTGKIVRLPAFIPSHPLFHPIDNVPDGVVLPTSILSF